jgi:hypothetical protein
MKNMGVMMVTRLKGLSGLALAALLPLSLSGQAICTGPHSSPTLSQGGSITTLPPGGGWVQLSFYRQRFQQFYNQNGDLQDFLASGNFLTRSVFLTASVGVFEGLDLWAQVPVHNLGVQTQASNSTSSGVGDLRFSVRITPELFGFEAPLGLRFGSKLPAGEFPVDATILPLTEGQRDFQISLESGTSFDFLPIYIAGWAGYRWRGLSEARFYDPGNETFAHFAIGGSAAGFGWELGADAYWGGAPVVAGLPLTQDARRVFQTVPTIGYAIGSGTLEVSAQIPVSGRNLPAGTGFGIGYRTGWRLL